MVPGPVLGALLAGIDIHALAGADAVEVLQARARQLSHEQARLLATMVEVGWCDPDAGANEVGRLVVSPLYAADEIRAALAWTRRAADRELDFAETLVLRMPAVFTALDTGRICRSKAWVFADLCAGLTAEQTAVVCARLLPQATRLTTGELAARIKRLAIALDPQWAARRYATAVRERNVIGYLNVRRHRHRHRVRVARRPSCCGVRACRRTRPGGHTRRASRPDRSATSRSLPRSARRPLAAPHPRPDHHRPAVPRPQRPRRR
jgi:hypothetical protein